MSLSSRAQAAEQSSQNLLVWKVILDQWNPKTNPAGIVSLGVAENTLMHERIAAHIRENLRLESHTLTYGDGPSGSKRLKRALSEFLNRQFKPVKPIELAHVVITNGVSAGIEHLSWALSNPGEGFLLGQPYYRTFPIDISERPAAKIVPVPFSDVDPLGDDAVFKYEEALERAEASGTKVAGLIVCNPHNPLGRCYPKRVLKKLMQLCEKNQIYFISDEIYALSTWAGCADSTSPPFTSCLSVDTEGLIDPSRVHALWGISKDFGANGLRLGAIITQSNASLCRSLIPLNLYSSASSLSDQATANMLEDTPWVNSYIEENRTKLAENYKIASSWADENRFTFKRGVVAGLFLWVDLGTAYRRRHPNLVAHGFELDRVMSEALLRNKVFLASGESFGSERPGWFRIVFSHPEAYLREGLSRVLASIS